jgi:signal transduction histidine kinase
MYAPATRSAIDLERETDTQRLAPWIELIAEAGDAQVRDRLLVQCAIAVGCARAAALWRPIEGRWREVLARGPREDLPQLAAFEALRSGALPEGAVAATRVVSAGSVALALGGVTCDEEALDPVEALVRVFALVERWSGTDALPGALPGGGDVRLAVPAEEDRQLRHDLANVLTSLRATEDVLQKIGDELSLADTRYYRGIVEHEVSRAGELLATAFVPRAPLAEGTCSPAEVLAHVIDAERALCTAADVRVLPFVEPRARDAVVRLTAADMSRVFQNLLVNAREALRDRRPANVWITLELAPSGQAVKATVEDDGPGIAQDLVERIFDPGFSTKPAGSDGQGLCIVQRRIEAAGGSIRARNRASGGAAFDVTLPVSR